MPRFSNLPHQLRTPQQSPLEFAITDTLATPLQLHHRDMSRQTPRSRHVLATQRISNQVWDIV